MQEKAHLRKKETEHTPGPWLAQEKLSGSENHKGWSLWATVKGEDGAPFRVWLGEISPVIEDGSGDPSTQGRANARLIAAAPDLLAACQEALGAFENNNAIDWNDLSRAIAKALGK